MQRPSTTRTMTSAWTERYVNDALRERTKYNLHVLDSLRRGSWNRDTRPFINKKRFGLTTRKLDLVIISYRRAVVQTQFGTYSRYFSVSSSAPVSPFMWGKHFRSLSRVLFAHSLEERPHSSVVVYTLTMRASLFPRSSRGRGGFVGWRHGGTSRQRVNQ